MNMLSIRNSIYNIIDKVTVQRLFDFSPEFIEILNKNRSTFLNILDNDALNPNDRNLIINSNKDPIQISGFPQKISLSQDFIQETLIISDLFKLNEITSVELLLSGEAESTSNPEMSRGLIAVINYYKSQRIIVESLRNLLRSMLIIITEENNNPRAIEIINFSQSYCDNLFQNRLFEKLINLLKTLNIEKEIELLESQRALGTAKHRRQFHSIFLSIKETIAECVLLRCFKSPLNTNDTKLFIGFMREFYKENEKEIKNENNETVTVQIVKKIDKCFIYLLISLMNSINPVINGNSVTNCSPECFVHPFFTDEEYTRTINDLIVKNITNDQSNADMKQQHETTKNLVENFDQVLYLSWIISLHKVSHLKQENNNSSNSYQATMSCNNFGDYEDLIECDQFNLDSAGIYEVFRFMTLIVNADDFCEENISIKCFHDFVTDFIIYLPKMLKDLKTESLRTATNVVYFSSLMGLIGHLHGLPERGGGEFSCRSSSANNEFLETLTLEFWAPQEIMTTTDIPSCLVGNIGAGAGVGAPGVAGNKNWNIKSNYSFKQATLFKFIRDCGDLIDNPELLVDFLFMLKGLCTNERVAVYIYNLFNSNLADHQNKLSWEHFSSCMHNHAKFYNSSSHKNQLMDPMELSGLLVVLQLIKQVTKMSWKVCESMVNNESLMLVQNLIFLLSCGVPKSLKAELFNCLAVFCQNPLVAKSIWQALELNNIIGGSAQQQLGHHSSCSSIQLELSENEPKLEEFHITRAFLNFLCVITPHIVCDISYLDQSMMSYDKLNSSIISPPNHYTVLENLTCVLQLVMDNVFLKHPMRTYRNIEEKFAICESFLKLCYKCVELFLAQSGNTKTAKNKTPWCQYDPGFFIINQLLYESPFFKTIISIIESGFLQITETLSNVTFGPRTLTGESLELLGNSIYLAMDLVAIVLKNESILVELSSKFNSQFKIENFRSNARFTRPRNFIPQELSRLLMTTGGVQSFLPNLIKYISIVDENERIARKALTIFNYCIQFVQPHSNLMLMLTNNNVVDIDILSIMVNCIDKFGDIDSSFVDCVENQKLSKLLFNDYVTDSPRTLVLKILINCLQQPTPNLGQYLMGFSCGSTFSVKRTSLQEAGVGDFPKTCLHSLLNLIQRLVAGISTNPMLKDDRVPVEYLPELTADMIDLSLGYRILFLLVSNSNTSMAVLRFIRSNYQFIFKQIDLLAFNTSKLNNIPELRALVWNQKSWLLKIITIEIRLCTANQQKSYISKLLRLLFGEDLYSSNSNTFLTWLSDENTVYQGLIYQIFEDFEITEPEEFIDFSDCQRLKPEVLKEYLNDCLEDTYMGIQLMNADKFKQIIFSDINMVVDEEQIRMLQYEVDSVCRLIDKYNTNVIWLHFGKSSAVEAWSQLVEVVMVSECSGEDCIDIEIKKKKIYEILQLVIEKILVSSTPICLTTPISRVCLILTAVIAGMFVCNQNENNFILQVMPDDEVGNTEERRLETVDADNLYTQLRMLIKLTTRCIMEINFKYQNTRIKFYGALTYLLEIVLTINTLNPNFSSLVNECYLVINNHSLLLEKISENSLYSTVCCDCISGNFHLSLSALTLLDCIAALDKDSGGLVNFLTSHGYLKHFIVSLIKDCENIYANMKHSHDTSYMRDSSNPNAMYSYYLYLSRMSLLCKLSTQHNSAKALVQCGALTNLSSCDLFRLRHVIGDFSQNLSSSDEENIDDIHVQYRTIVSLAVQFANNILATLGLEKSDAIREVLIFIGESIDSFCEPFQSPINACNSISIKEMIQISNLFVLLVPGILKSKSLSEVEYKYRTMEKIKRIAVHVMTFLLELLNKPIHSDNEMMLHFLQIQLMGNFLSIASGFVAPCSNETNRIFFSASIDDSIGGKNNWNSAIRKISQSVHSGNKPPMSLIVLILYKMQECFENVSKKLSFFESLEYDVNIANNDSKRLLSTREIEDKLMRMSTDQLQLLWNSIFENVSSIEDRIDFVEESVAYRNSERDIVKDLVVIYKRITNVVSSLKYSLENCCFLLWNHASAYKSTTMLDNNDFLVSDVSLHPIQRLHKIQQIKMELGQPRTTTSTMNQTANEDIVVVLSKCIDNDLLRKIQSALEMHSSGNEDNSSSFSKILIHRLIRMLKLN